jgi:predicted GIY-YIG superfamily endonuclease
MSDDLIFNDQEQNEEINVTVKTTKTSFVYLLQSTDGSTYVGATVDLDHRLLQHNKKLKGGAVQTSRKVDKGQTWERICYVSGFPSWQAALQFEWRWKQITRMKSNKNPLIRRFVALHHLLQLEQATSKAIPYAEWPTQPEIHFEVEKNKLIYEQLKS